MAKHTFPSKTKLLQLYHKLSATSLHLWKAIKKYAKAFGKWTAKMSRIFFCKAKRGCVLIARNSVTVSATVGTHTAKLFKKSSMLVARFSTKVAVPIRAYIVKCSKKYAKIAANYFKQAAAFLVSHAVTLSKKGFVIAKAKALDFIDFSKATAKKYLGIAKRFWVSLKATQGLKGKAYKVKSACSNHRVKLIRGMNYALSSGAICILCAVVLSFANTQYVIAVNQNGELVGYIDDQTTYQEAKSQIDAQLVYNEGDQALALSPEFTVAKVDSSEPISEPDELASQLVQASDSNVQEGNGLYVDGTFYGVVGDSAYVQDELNKMKADYAAQTGTTNVTIHNEVEFKEGIYFCSGVKSQEEMVALLHSNIEEQTEYQVQEGEDLLAIATTNNTSCDALKALNPEITNEIIYPGQVLKIGATNPLIDLKGTKQMQYEEVTPFEQISQENGSIEKGTTVVSQQGQEGKSLVTADVEVINGQEGNRTVLSSTPTQESVPQITQVGTKPFGLIRPVSSGYVSCGYSSGHRAVDIATSNGTPIYAAAGGTVVLASWYSSYGNCVIIDHGNGIQTLYAHQSKIGVSVGQKVSQGDTIGYVGSTGNSTGNHLHFEVKVNGVNQNPNNYVKF